MRAKFRAEARVCELPQLVLCLLQGFARLDVRLLTGRKPGDRAVHVVVDELEHMGIDHGDRPDRGRVALLLAASVIDRANVGSLALAFAVLATHDVEPPAARSAGDDAG
jgi:hypothetical protein